MTGRDEQDDEDRAVQLDEIRATYRRYRSSGYAGRWQGSKPGWAQAVAERDRWLLQQLRGAASVVDLGCGTGDLAVMLDAAGARPASYLGVDLLEERLGVARGRAPWASFVESSADRTPVALESVDAVAAITLVSSLPKAELRRAVALSVARMLRPGGAFVIYDLRYPSPRNPAVRPVSIRELRSLFPGWGVRTRTLTLLPPLARSRLAAGRRRYRALAAVPFLRSHLGVVLVKPR